MKIKLTFISLVAFFALLLACQTTTEKKEKTQDVVQEDYLKKGSDIAGTTFSVLSGQLQKALKSGGLDSAIQYCNLAAMPLVDSLSQIHQAQIRRTSMKVRNPKNSPTLEEKLVLQTFEKNKSEGKALLPIVRTIDENKVAFYAPIQAIDFCLQCHGKVGETLKQDDYALIQQFYPNDKATGYEAGDLRGMWSIQFTTDGRR